MTKSVKLQKEIDKIVETFTPSGVSDDIVHEAMQLAYREGAVRGIRAFATFLANRNPDLRLAVLSHSEEFTCLHLKSKLEELTNLTDPDRLPNQ